jgi:hypothetical protein
VEPAGIPVVRLRARIESDGRTGPWFDWALVGADAVVRLAPSAGLRVDDVWEEAGGRWFAEMTRR